jgi:hypothetical protein
MHIVGKVMTAAALTGLFAAATAGAATADQNANSSGFTLLPVNHNGNDSLVEIDRALNFSDGGGNTGSDISSRDGEPDEAEPDEAEPDEHGG